jgi:hypothetical protein
LLLIRDPRQVPELEADHRWGEIMATLQFFGTGIL